MVSQGRGPLSVRKRLLAKPPRYTDPRLLIPELADRRYEEAMRRHASERREHERHAAVVGMVTDAVLIVALLAMFAIGWSSALIILNVVTSLPLVYVAAVRVPRDVRRWRANQEPDLILPSS
jgi:hypothetical protein